MGDREERGEVGNEPNATDVVAVSVATITRLVRVWQKRLHLTEWRISVKVGEFEEEGRFGKLSAACVAEPEYLEARVYVDPEHAARVGEDLNRLMCHELAHCLTAELVSIADQWAGDDPGRKEFVKQAHERLVSRWERVMCDE